MDISKNSNSNMATQSVEPEVDMPQKSSVSMATTTTSEDDSSRTISLNRGTITFTTNPTPRLVFTSPNRSEARDLFLFGDAAKNLSCFLPKAFEVARSLPGEKLAVDQDNIYYDVLSFYTAQTLQMKNTLSVCSFNGYVNIWIRRFFLAKDTGKWQACKGGFQFTMNDNETCVMNFLERYMEVLKPSRKRARSTDNTEKEDAESALKVVAT